MADQSRTDNRSLADRRLTPFEEYMYLDDSREYPMCLFLRLSFSGPIDRQRFETAVGRAAANHPRLASPVSADANRYRWGTPNSHATQSNIHWRAGVSEDFPPAQLVDLAASSGLQIVVEHTTDRAVVNCQFHHTCCDGIGAVDFVSDLLRAYDRPDDPTHSLGRRTDHSRWSVLRRIDRVMAVPINLWFGLFRLRDFLRFRATPLVPDSVPDQDAAAQGPVPFPAVISVEFSAAESAQIFRSAKSHQATVNDWLMRDLLTTLGETHSGRARPSVDADQRRDVIRLLTPVNLRGEASLPQATNHVGMIFVDRRHDQLQAPHLLAGVRREMQRVKRWYLGQTSLRTLRVCRYLPGGLRSFLDSRDCWATAVMSNLGRPFPDDFPTTPDGLIRSGDLVLDAVRFVAPIRAQTNVAFGIVTYANRLAISLQFDSRRMSRDDAANLMQAFQHRIATSAKL